MKFTYDIFFVFLFLIISTDLVNAYHQKSFQLKSWKCVNKLDFPEASIPSLKYSDYSHVPLSVQYLQGLKALNKFRKNYFLLNKIKEILTVVDMGMFLVVAVAHKKILRFLYSKGRSKPFSEKDFKGSILGKLEPAITCSCYFFPFLYLLDFFSIFIHFIGFDFHLKVLDFLI